MSMLNFAQKLVRKKSAILGRKNRPKSHQFCKYLPEKRIVKKKIKKLKCSMLSDVQAMLFILMLGLRKFMSQMLGIQDVPCVVEGKLLR